MLCCGLSSSCVSILFDFQLLTVRSLFLFRIVGLQSLQTVHSPVYQYRIDTPQACRKSANYNILSYARFYNDNSVIVAINNNDGEREIAVEVWQAEVFDEDYLERVMLTTQQGHSCEILRYDVPNGVMSLKLPAYSAAVFIKRRGTK